MSSGVDSYSLLNASYQKVCKENVKLHYEVKRLNQEIDMIKFQEKKDGNSNQNLRGELAKAKQTSESNSKSYFCALEQFQRQLRKIVEVKKSGCINNAVEKADGQSVSRSDIDYYIKSSAKMLESFITKAKDSLALDINELMSDNNTINQSIGWPTEFNFTAYMENYNSLRDYVSQLEGEIKKLQDECILIKDDAKLKCFEVREEKNAIVNEKNEEIERLLQENAAIRADYKKLALEISDRDRAVSDVHTLQYSTFYCKECSQELEFKKIQKMVSDKNYVGLLAQEDNTDNCNEDLNKQTCYVEDDKNADELLKRPPWRPIKSGSFSLPRLKPHKYKSHAVKKSACASDLLMVIDHGNTGWLDGKDDRFGIR